MQIVELSFEARLQLFGLSCQKKGYQEIARQNMILWQQIIQSSCHETDRLTPRQKILLQMLVLRAMPPQ